MTDKMVLIVDDEPNIRQIVQMVFEELAGVQTILAEDGEEALDRVRAAKPDLILLDLMIPKMDGFEVLRRLKADPATMSIPVVAVTACGREKCQQALAAGCADIILKPFDVEDLATRVEFCLKSFDAARPRPGIETCPDVWSVDALAG